MALTIENPTHRAKAIRDAGGLTVIKPESKVTVDALDDEARQRYEAAGLVIKADKPKAAAKAEK